MAKRADGDEKDAVTPADSGGTVTMVVVGLAALGLAGWMGYEFYVPAAASAWPTTEGVVKSLKVWEKTRVSGGTSNYQVEITYEYTINGQTYTGDMFNSRNNHIDASDIPSVKQQFAPGSRCQVSYSTWFPSQSTLKRDGLSWNAWVKLALAVVSLGGAVFFLYFAFQKDPPKPAEDDEEKEGPPPPPRKKRPAEQGDEY